MKHRKTRKTNTLNMRILGIVLLLPALLFISFTMLIPIIWNIVLSFAHWDGFSSMKSAGFDNYYEAFHDKVTLKGFYYSIFIALISTLIAIMSGVSLALMIYRTGKKEGAFFRFVFFSPSMMPFTVIGFLFVFILSPDIGLFNSLLKLIGLEGLQHAWLAERETVLWTIAIIGGWRFSGIVMMLCYTAILTIPASMFEAARMEGLGFVRQVQMIILPLIMPTLRLVIMLMLILSFKTYDVVWAMTKGGPGDFSRTVPVRMLDVAFRFNEFGYAAAIGVLLTILVAVTIFVAQRLVRGNVYEY